MSLTKTLSLAVLATAFLLSSCKKDDDDTSTPATSCKLAKSIYFDANGGRADSAVYTYTGDKVSKAALTQEYFTFEYTGDRITKRTSFSTGETTPDYFQQVTYNSDGTIAKIESFAPGTGTSSQIFDRMEFVYASGKLSQMNYYDLSATTPEKLLETSFTYTGNNITSVSLKDISTSESETINYTYDTNPNYLKKQNAQIHLLDPFFLFFHILNPYILPFALSSNNVTALTEAGSPSSPITYTLDDKQNVIKIKDSNASWVDYAYQCQ